jgi:hypothetical protein
MIRLQGHKLTIEGSTERCRAERSHTGTCKCGWEESASTYEEVRWEYRNHLQREKAREHERMMSLHRVLQVSQCC